MEPLQPVDNEDAGGIEDEHGDRILFPTHFLVRIHAGELVEEPLNRTEYRVEKRSFMLVHPRDEMPQRIAKCDEGNEVEYDLDESVGRHSNISGFKSATNR